MSGHTPGPWRVEVEAVEAAEESDEPIREVYVCHPGTLCTVSVVATMATSRWVSLAEREANARLIAAAPDLLISASAARAALATAIIAHSDGLFDRETVAEHPVIARLDAAITKATGEPA